MFRIISFWAATNVSTGHIPSFCLGQPRIPVSGATASLIMTRIWGPGNEVHSKTDGREVRKDLSDEQYVIVYIRWNWILVANGASSADLNVRSWGIWVYGRGPDSAKLVKFSAVITKKIQISNNEHAATEKKTYCLEQLLHAWRRRRGSVREGRW